MTRALFFEWVDQHRRTLHMTAIPTLLLLVASVYVLVYMTGGSKFVYSHTMYIPILLSGFILGTRGGILVRLLAGVVLGPFMPISVLTGEM
jgi:hypothetical protein